MFYKLLFVTLFFPYLVMSQDVFEIPQSLLNQVEKGNAEAAYFIAITFEKGSESIKPDAEKALMWMKKSAKMNFPQAMFELGQMLIIDDENEALKWFISASEKGHSDAIQTIGYYYIEGLGDIEQDCQKAYLWFDKAEIKGNKIAYNDHIWSLATSANKACQNPEKALFLMSKLIKLYQDDYELVPLSVLDTQAAMYASISDFNKAIKIQQSIVDKLSKSSSKNKEFKERLDRYISRKTWSQSN